MLNNRLNKGKVIFASAGPGDPELITLKTKRYLEQADVVLVDRLVSKEILINYASSSAQVIEVGKQGGNKNSVKQENIDQLLVKYALEGQLVLRLKGGDSSIFSNILSELNAVTRGGIHYEIVPGVTAALGAAAFSGIPLTARGYARSVRFVTAYDLSVCSEKDWENLASTEDTLVFYMSTQLLPEIVEKLVNLKIDDRKKIAVIEQATTPKHHVITSSLYTYNQNFSVHKFASPSLVIIGKVVNLHEKFKWFQPSQNHQNYFNPLKQQSYAQRTQTQHS